MLIGRVALVLVLLLGVACGKPAGAGAEVCSPTDWYCQMQIAQESETTGMEGGKDLVIKIFGISNAWPSCTVEVVSRSCFVSACLVLLP